MKPIKQIIIYSLSFLAVLGASSCSKMDDYKKFLSEGETRYTGKVDSVMAYPGKNRIMLSWLLISDPKIVKCRVFWNNKTDSAEISVQRTDGIDTIELMLNDLAEGDYNFEIYTYDSKGNPSVPVFANGTVYGDSYRASLFPRMMVQGWLKEGDGQVDWTSADKGAVGIEVEYTDTAGLMHALWVPADSNHTILENYKAGTLLKYRTLYLPESLSIDTFSTDYESEKLLFEIDRSGWTVTGFDSEEANGEGADNGHVIHAFDANLDTYWHTQWDGAQPGPPHFVSVDMGSSQALNGFFFVPRGSGNGNAKDIQIEVSTDGTVWENAGDFTLDDSGDKKLVFLDAPMEARHFKITVNNSHGDKYYTFFDEIGAF